MKGIIEVDLSKGCYNCPLVDYEYEERCTAMANREDYANYSTRDYRKEVPQWCPFRKGKIVLKGD